jgi:hypothetical protein
VVLGSWPGRYCGRVRRATNRTALLAASIVIAGCGSQSQRDSTAPATSAGAAASALPQAHPQIVNPTAGVQGVVQSDPGTPAVGDPTAHAPSLAQVKRELNQLNLCGGATSSTGAQPIVKSSAPGFVADPGTNQSVGQLPLLTHQLDLLAKALGVTIYGISGYRTPAHSVAVGGYANDPHTLGLAEDIGVGSLLRSSAAAISEADLARYGMYRPFDPTDDPNNSEVNHIQLIPAGGPLSLAEADATWDPDPTCS